MSINQKAMLAGVKIQVWSARKLDRKVTDDTNRAHNAQADAGRYNKALISKDALAEIVAISNRARKEHYARTLPWADNGNRILSASGYADFANIMRELGDEFDAAVRKFLANYDAFVADARIRLNGMFDASDYPASDEIARRFSFKKQIWPMPDASDFRVDLSAGESDRVRAEIAAEFDSAMQMAMRDVFERIADCVGKMSEKLKPTAGDAKAEIFRDSMVGNIRELVGLLPSLNVTCNATLDRIGQRMERELCRYEPDALRDDKQARQDTKTAADEILAEIADFIA